MKRVNVKPFHFKFPSKDTPPLARTGTACTALVSNSAMYKHVPNHLFVRFSMATSPSNSIILMADGERSTRQILRAVQHSTAQLGLHTEVEDNRS